LQLLPPVFQLVNCFVLDLVAAVLVNHSILAVGSLGPKHHLPQLFNEVFYSDQEEEQLSLSDSSLAAGPKQHRLQLLRSWLLYFVTVVHGYFMSRVLATTELELRDQLMRAKDLDKLIEVHQNYINRIYDRQVPYCISFRLLRLQILYCRRCFLCKSVHGHFFNA
jgi:hypothetical protein